ncbi:uncharacterized protein ARMOST_00288 [Armillaria ostoyae]|uniref:Uncharacterized protein n=1 Tax=Armillaria ostoyae TaxID=47428 RepID=A0A284QKN4_ARMOS|nr:uncharacterized protein ARMOST_00288 [Armillaria ostoyae]
MLSIHSSKRLDLWHREGTITTVDLFKARNIKVLEGPSESITNYIPLCFCPDTYVVSPSRAADAPRIDGPTSQYEQCPIHAAPVTSPKKRDRGWKGRSFHVYLCGAT